MEAFLISLSTVAIAEMGDRTQLLALVLAAHYRKPWPILAGIFCATLANHAVAGADVSATSAWDRTTGASSILIAIIDDGVDITHPGLRIFTNPGESGGGKETNALDDENADRLGPAPPLDQLGQAEMFT